MVRERPNMFQLFFVIWTNVLSVGWYVVTKTSGSELVAAFALGLSRSARVCLRALIMAVVSKSEG